MRGALHFLKRPRLLPPRDPDVQPRIQHLDAHGFETAGAFLASWNLALDLVECDSATCDAKWPGEELLGIAVVYDVLRPARTPTAPGRFAVAPASGAPR